MPLVTDSAATQVGTPQIAGHGSGPHAQSVGEADWRERVRSGTTNYYSLITLTARCTAQPGLSLQPTANTYCTKY